VIVRECHSLARKACRAGKQGGRADVTGRVVYLSLTQFYRRHRDGSPGKGLCKNGRSGNRTTIVHGVGMEIS